MKLILLRCPNCQHALKPDNDEIVFTCPNCHRPIMLDEEGPHLAAVRFAIPENYQGSPTEWAPFWVFDGRVNILRRETQGGRSSDKDAQKTWEAIQRFFVPSWDGSVHIAQEIGTKITLRQPRLTTLEQPGEVILTPATVSAEDSLKLLEFVVLAVEARRKDWLKELQFDIEVGEPQMFALPESSLR
jgi:hypothetical protein